MQSTFLNCDKKQGTVEITLSKRETSLEKVLICADYSMIEKDKYKVEFYYGFINIEIMSLICEVTWSVEYGQLKGYITEYVQMKLNDKEFMKQLRKELRSMKKNQMIEFDLSWKIIKYHPEKEIVGFEGIEITFEYNESQANVYVSGRDGNRYTIDKIEFTCENGVPTESQILVIDKYVKETLIEENELSNFIFENLSLLGLQEEI